jgi:CheY-like chemotaxis protein
MAAAVAAVKQQQPGQQQHVGGVQLSQQQQQQAGGRVIVAKQGDYTKSSLYAITSSGDSASNASGNGRPTQTGSSGSKSSSQAADVGTQGQQHVQQGLAAAAAAAGGYASGPMQNAMAAAGGSALLPAGPSPGPSDKLPPTAPGPPTGSIAGAAAAAAAAAAANDGSSINSSGQRSRQLSLDGKQIVALDTSRLVGKRVLLAEDNLINQTVARKMLSSIGMQVEVASNGAEAVAAVRRTRPNDGSGQQPLQRVSTDDGKTSSSSQQPFTIVLMDMAMPVMGGVEATRTLREDGFTLPIVAMTANASDKDRDECAAAGMNGFLSKPVLRDQLARAMLAAVEAAEAAAADALSS